MNDASTPPRSINDMNKKIKQRWIDALTSGKYKQGKSALHQVINGEERFCCLGVLCDLALRDGAIKRRTSDVDFFLYGQREGGALPPTVMRWAGLSTNNGGLPNDAPDLTLVEANDSGRSFEQIAKLIEKYL